MIPMILFYLIVLSLSFHQIQHNLMLISPHFNIISMCQLIITLQNHIQTYIIANPQPTPNKKFPSSTMPLTLQKVANLYILVTTAFFLYTFSETYHHSSNYFSAWLIYLDDTITNFLFYNMIFAMGIVAYKLCIWMFFVEVKENESLKLVQKLKARIMDVLLLVYILDGQVEMDSFACIIFVFFSYIVHCMAMFRAQYLIHAPASLSLGLNYRLTFLLLIILFCDYEILSYSLQLLYSQSVTHFVFVYYTITISLSLIEPSVKYFLDFYQKYTLTHIRNIDQRMAVVSLWISVPRLLIQIVLAVWMVMRFNLFIYLIFNVIELVSQLTTVIKSYNRVKKLTDTMKNLKKIDEEEIKKHHDNTCMVCFQDMHEATLLPCKHFFHDQCLRQWIIKNANHFCPKCKKEFNFEAKGEQNNDQRREGEENRDRVENQREVNERLRLQRLKRLERVEERMNMAKNKRQGKEEKFRRQNTAEKDARTKLQSRPTFYKNLIKEEEIPELSPEIKPPAPKHRSRQSSQQAHQNLSSPAFQILSWDTPQQIVEQRRKRYVRMGSLAYGLPTQAVYRRTYRHMYVRDTYERVNEELIRDLSLREYEQMMLFAER